MKTTSTAYNRWPPSNCVCLYVPSRIKYESFREFFVLIVDYVVECYRKKYWAKGLRMKSSLSSSSSSVIPNWPNWRKSDVKERYKVTVVVMVMISRELSQVWYYIGTGPRGVAYLQVSAEHTCSDQHRHLWLPHLPRLSPRALLVRRELLLLVLEHGLKVCIDRVHW